MFQKAFKGACTSTVLLSPDPLSPTPSTSSTMKTPDNTEDDTEGPEPAEEGQIQMEYFSDQLCSPSIGALIKIYL
jgi:hypothetical protein